MKRNASSTDGENTRPTLVLKGQTAEKANGMTDHGEAGSVWWEVIKDPVSQ